MGKTVTTKRKKQIALILILALVICALIPIGVFGIDGERTDITERVDINGVRVEAYAEVKNSSQWKEDWQTFIDNGAIADGFEDYVVKAYEGLRIYVDWSISEENMAGIEEGDFFKVQLDPNVFNLSDITDEPVYAYDEDGNETVIGRLTTKDSALVVTLNSVGAGASELSEGWILGAVSVKKDASSEINTTIAGVDINFNFEPAAPSDPTSTGTIWGKSNPGAITKTGWTQDGKKYAEFNLQVNGEALYEKLKNNTDKEVKENVIVKDLLPLNLKFRTDVEPVSFAVVYYLMMGDTEDGKNTAGEVAKETFANISITKEYSEINTAGMTMGEFEKKIESTPYSYGIFEDVYFMANMGDMPSNEIMMPLSKSEISSKLMASPLISAGGVINQSRYDNTIAAYDNVYGSNENVPALSFYHTLRTNYIGNGGEDDKAKNTASIQWKNSVPEESTTVKEFSVFSGGANMGKKYSATIKKIDGDTNEALDGVQFRLEKFNAETKSYVPYKSLYDVEIKATSDGAAVFQGLSKGKYKVIEEKGLEGYTDKIEFLDADGGPGDGTFELTGDETGTIYVTAKNFKQDTPEEKPVPTTTPEAVITPDAIVTPGVVDTSPGAVAGEEGFPGDITGSTDDGSVLGEEGNPGSNSDSVLGDEAKTVDAMNMVPLFIIVLVVTLLILAVSLQARRKEE